MAKLTAYNQATKDTKKWYSMHKATTTTKSLEVWGSNHVHASKSYFRSQKMHFMANLPSCLSHDKQWPHWNEN